MTDDHGDRSRFLLGVARIFEAHDASRIDPERCGGLRLARSVAWRAGKSQPVVQCVQAQREGQLTGGGVELLAISKPIPGEASCG